MDTATTNHTKQGILKQSTAHTRESGECVVIAAGTPVRVIDSELVGKVTFLTLESPDGDVFRVQSFKFETTTTTLQNWATVIQEVNGCLTQHGLGHKAEPFAGVIPEEWIYDRWINEHDEVVHQWSM